MSDDSFAMYAQYVAVSVWALAGVAADTSAPMKSTTLATVRRQGALDLESPIVMRTPTLVRT